MRAFLTLTFLSLSLSAAALAQSSLENGVAITDPAIVQQLERKGYSITGVLFPGSSPMKNDNLFKGKLKSVEDTLTKDIRTLPSLSLDDIARATFPNEHSSPELRMSESLINDRRSSFVLTGVVNRMDRAYRTLSPIKKLVNCGEVRFLYRFTYDIKVQDSSDSSKELDVASRLPFTLSVVFNAKGDKDPISCADIAKRWQGLDGITKADDVVTYLTSEKGPLKYLKPTQIDRIEANLQLFRLPASVKKDFGGHAEYLLRVFRRDSPNDPFVVTRLENQFDRAALKDSHNGAKLAEFKNWVLKPAALDELDRGVLEIPFNFLADRAISVSPGGSARAQNQPSFDLFTDQEILDALAKYEAKSGKKLQSIKSANGFRARMDDLTCSGCHQARTIAGFHFPGADPDTEAPSNAVHVPGSAHFEADLPRRRAIVDAFAAKKQPDFSRPFNSRPDERYRSALASTQLFDGWGAPCHFGDDPSFAAWTCRAGLTCKSTHASDHQPKMGICVTAAAIKIGDPVEFGKVVHDPVKYGNDSYTRLVPSGSTDPDHYEVPDPPSDRSDYRVAHQGWRQKDSTGGFPGGMLRIGPCEDLPGTSPLPQEAKCGRVAATGFNDCIAQGKPFTECLKKTETAGLRACDSTNPCRSDYICTAPYDLPGPKGMGTCIPPYFMFQFRVDGHPKAPVENEPVQASEDHASFGRDALGRSTSN
jgi:hypothetical protein